MLSCFALIWNAANPHDVETACAINAKLPKNSTLHEEPGFLLLDMESTGAGQNLLPIVSCELGPGGAVYGVLFRNLPRNEGACRLTQIGEDEAGKLIRTAGSSLSTSFWGSYIAFVRSEGAISVITDPSASVPCHYVNIDGVTVVFSHLEKCDFIDRALFSVDEDFVSRLMVYDKIQNGQTGLKEIKELTGGERLVTDGRRQRRDRIWDPGKFARQPLDTSAQDAAYHLRETCKGVVSAWASCFDAVSISLSGGLDSAIVLSCIAHAKAGSDVSAFHNLLQSGDTSELQYARDAAEQADVRLDVIESRPPDVLPSVYGHPASVRPFRSFLALPMRSPFDPGDTRLKSTAIFTGQGGDHLFLARRSPLGFADHLHRRGLSGRPLAELLNASQLSGLSVWKTAAASARGLMNKRISAVDAAVRSRQSKLAGLTLHDLNMSGSYPAWALEGDGIAPLKFLQLSSLAHLQQVRNRMSNNVSWSVIDPLVSQPLIELCLKIPSEVLCAGGISRGLARQAFLGHIPDSIRLRMSKGSASGYFDDFLGNNRAELMEALTRGELARRGLLSPGDLQVLLDPSADGARHLGRTLLIWYAIEAWLRTWKGA